MALTIVFLSRKKKKGGGEEMGKPYLIFEYFIHGVFQKFHGTAMTTTAALTQQYQRGDR